MIKVVVVSDSHGEDDPLRKVIEDNPDADYIIHCGDLVTPASKFENLIAVQGNHDWQYNSSLPLERILKIASHNVLIMHSHTLPLTIDNYKRLIAQQGRKQGCDIVLFGHVHLPSADVIDGITIINPGSLFFNFKLTPIGYDVLLFNDDGTYSLSRVTLPEEFQIT